MRFMNRFRPTGQHDVASDAIQTSDTQAVNVNTEKGDETGPREAQNDWVKVPEESVPAEHAQYGIQKIEAVTLTWSKKSLAALLCK
jgi:hypothetical protein